MPEISVIIPVYNQEEYVGACMDSLLDQSFEDFEVLAVNDGSTDASVSILEGYEQRDGRVQLIDQKMCIRDRKTAVRCSISRSVSACAASRSISISSVRCVWMPTHT